MPAGRHSDSTPDNRRAHDYRAVCTVQAAFQTATAVVVAARWLVVGTGEHYAVVEWIRGAMWVQFAYWIISFVRLLRVSCGLGGKAQYFLDEF